MAKPASTPTSTSALAFAGWPAWLLILGLAAAYFATARLGMLLAMPGGHVTPVWPPSGVALAALLLCGRRVWHLAQAHRVALYLSRKGRIVKPIGLPTKSHRLAANEPSQMPVAPGTRHLVRQAKTLGQFLGPQDRSTDHP